MLSLSENELLDINGGKGIGDYLPNLDEIYDGAKKVYKELRDGDYDSIKDFGKGFSDGWSNPDN